MAEKNDDATARRKVIEDRLKALGVKPSQIKSVYKIGEDLDAPVTFVPTGQIEVDQILGDGGGIPLGTLIEFCGLSGSGKTYLAMKHAAEHQKLGRRVAYLDVENTFYKPRALDIGLSLDLNLFELYDNLGYGEVYGELAERLAESGEYGVIVIDSIKAMNPKDEVDKMQGDVAKVGAHAMMIKRMLMKLTPACAATDTTIILINQFYHTVKTSGPVMPNSEQLAAAGGKAMEYMCHMRLWINKIMGQAGHVIDVVDGEQMRVGGKSRLEVYKTRYGTPLVRTEFSIMFGANEGNPVAEFIYRASARGKDFVEYTGRGAKKSYKFIDKSGGELNGVFLSEAADAYDFVAELLTGPAPSKLTRGDTSTTGFEYICGRLKINDLDRQRIIDKLSNRTEVVIATDDETD